VSGTMAPAVTPVSTPSGGMPGAGGRRDSRLLGLPLAILLQAVNAAGDGLAMVALANRVYQVSHASWAVAAVFIAVTVPISALAPVAGLILDRLPVKPVLIAAAAAEAAIAAALVLATGLTATLILATGFGICAAVLQPGLGAMVPRLVRDGQLIRANSYLQAATWIGFTVGPLLAGLLITVSGSALALGLNAVLYALAAAGLVCLRLAPKHQDPADAHGDHTRRGVGTQLKAGFRYLRDDVDAGILVGIVGIMVAFANMAVVAEVVFAEQVLHSGPAGYSLLVAGWTAGMVVGTLAGGRLRKHWLMAGALAGTVVTGAGVVLAGLSAVLWQAVVAYAAGGLANGFETVATRSFIGHRAPANVAGRVFAVYSGIIFGGISVGMAVAAGLLTVLGARGLLVVSGAGGILAGLAGCLIYLLRRRQARRLAAALSAPAPAGDIR
jgi:MFS family permease